MRSFLLVALFANLLLVPPAIAQVPEVRNLATDTLQPTSTRPVPLMRLGTLGGQTLYVFFSGYKPDVTGIYFTYRYPATLPRPKLTFISTEQLRWVRIGSLYQEPIRLAGRKAGPLAERVLTGPVVELFDYATAKRGVPIPLPMGGVMMTGGLFKGDKFNHTWYLRRLGERTMTQVPEGKKFISFLTSFLSDAPSIVAAVQAGAKGYGYNDVPAILAEYTQAGNPTKP